MNSLRAQFLLTFMVSLLTVLNPQVGMAKTNDFRVLCYHDVSLTSPEDAYGVTVSQLQEQFEYLKKNYKVISIEDVILASQGKKTLPKKAVLITFDDGLGSFYELVYPLLKKYKFPAVFAVVGKWIDEGKSPDYGYARTNPAMVSWKQLKEMSDSGWVAVVSHTYNSHYGHQFNPQGNEQAAAGFLKYDPAKKTYESEAAFFARIKTDLIENEERIRKHIGKNHPIIVWPYGTFNGLSQKAATELGLYMQFSIENGLNNAGNLALIRRGMVLSSFSLSLFKEAMKTSFLYQAPPRAVTVDVDSIWTGNEDESNNQLGKLNDKATEVRPNLALIQSFSSQGEAYFPTGEAPVKAHFFPRVAHVLQNRSRIEKVYARLPLRYLKSVEATERLIHDLALYSDVDGVFFDSHDFQGSGAEELMAQAMRTGSELRPFWSYGLVGPLKTQQKDRFKFFIKEMNGNLPAKKLAQKVQELKDSKMIVVLDSQRSGSFSKDYQKWRGVGVNSFFLPVPLNSYEDISFLKEHFRSEKNPYSMP